MRERGEIWNMSEQCNVRIMQQAIVDFVDGGSRAEAKEFNGLNARNGLQVTARKKKVGIFVLQFKGIKFCQQYK